MAAASILHKQVAAVCPILGVSVGNIADRSTWSASFDLAATLTQRAAAESVLATFDLAAAVAAEIQSNQMCSTDPDFGDLLSRLQSATPAQIKNYIQNNVTDLPSAKALLAKILVALSLLIGRI